MVVCRFSDGEAQQFFSMSVNGHHPKTGAKIMNIEWKTK